MSEAFLSPNKFFSLDLDPFSSSSSRSSTPSAAIRKSSYFFTDNFIDMSDLKSNNDNENDSEHVTSAAAEPFEDPFNNLKNNNKETKEKPKSNSSTRSQSPVVLKSVEETTNSVLKELNDKLNDESLPQLSVDEIDQDEESEGDDMDSYFKNPPSSILTNTGDISLNLNITNTEEILPTLNEIEDSPLNNNLLNQFDVALRSGQNYDKINIEPVKLDETKVEEEDEEEEEEEEEEEKSDETVTTTTTTVNNNNKAVNEEDSSLVSLLTNLK